MGGWHAHPLVAQWLEQRPSKTWVAGSSPAKGAEALKIFGPRQGGENIKDFVAPAKGTVALKVSCPTPTVGQQVFSTRIIACFSAGVTHNPYLDFTCTWRDT